MKINLSLKFIISISLVLVIVMGLTFALILHKHEQMAMRQVDMQARALFNQIVITRRWVADHGGVFVEKQPWVKPNPYLPNTTITGVNGKSYVLRNPALVTKQLSQYAELEKVYKFHITSLKLMNPENSPDEFETKSMREFEKKVRRESSTVEKIEGNHYYRYIAPLYVEQACLACHRKQGYRIGDVRGAISVSIPMEQTRAMIANERFYMIGGMIMIGLFIMVALYLVTRRMVISPVRAIQAQMSRFADKGLVDMPPVSTGDEMEDLNLSFHEMAASIQKNHSCMQEKIRAATSELTIKNETLAKSYRSKADFIAKTSHELRTPLTAIKGAMDYLSVKLSLRETDEDRDLRVFFEMIKKNAERMIRLLNNILDYERIELGSFEMNFGNADLKEAFEEVVSGFNPLAEKKQVTIRTNVTDVTARADADRIKQVLTNLLTNALNFSPPGSEVVVRLECRDDTVQAGIEDQGSGVPDSDKELIFTQFYTKGVKEGTGLGLAICKRIIEAHGGEIGVEPAESGGSRFWFSIPRVRKEEKTDEEATACG